MMTDKEKLDELRKFQMRIYFEAELKPENEYQIYKRIYTELDGILNDREGKIKCGKAG